MLKVREVLVVPDGTKWEDVASGLVEPQVAYEPISVIIKTNSNAKYFPIIGETNTMPSKTVPNQSMSVRELMIRFAAGLPLTGAKVPLYEGESEEPDIDKMDLIEREAYYKELAERRAEVVKRIKDAKMKAEEVKMERIVADRIAKKQADEEKKLIEEFRKSKEKLQ